MKFEGPDPDRLCRPSALALCVVSYQPVFPSDTAVMHALDLLSGIPPAKQPGQMVQNALMVRGSKAGLWLCEPQPTEPRILRSPGRAAMRLGSCGDGMRSPVRSAHTGSWPTPEDRASEV